MPQAIPSLLSFARSLSPSHMLMYSAPHMSGDDNLDVPVTVREEPLRGLNATASTPESKRDEAVLQVVESAELAPGHTVLVLKGRLLVKNHIWQPYSCNEPGFVERHGGVLTSLKDSGAQGFRELAVRYAIQLACGGIGWRNHAEATEHAVIVEHSGQQLRFQTLYRDADDPFNVGAASYAGHRDQIATLAGWIEDALTRSNGRGSQLKLRLEYLMGIGSRVYASQEWASTDVAQESVRRWPGGRGITRVLAKLRLPSGERQAIINDRKAGNALRTIDTWYPGAARNRPISIEPYGASSHEGRAHRATNGSLYQIMQRVAVDNAGTLTQEEMLFYAAVCIRGGVFGAAGDKGGEA